MDTCIFCNIIAGKIPTKTKLYEDEHSFVLLSNGPMNPGHTLVLPKAHYANIHEIPENTTAEIFKITKKFCTLVKETMEADGVNIMMNNGKAAGQAVFHAHIHVIPRFFGDKIKNWEHSREYKVGEAEKIAENIRSELNLNH